ncbi:MAG TPA: hypothetical protein VN622_02980 [Clostridia bacterium]|nr:hypothetical protein [Clostridia bacterium]
MRLCAFAAAFLVAIVPTSTVLAQHHVPDADPAMVQSKAPLLDNIGNLHHVVSTENKLAQRYFDQGLTLAYGFNHMEAERSFLNAAGLDPRLAMAYWGQALALGPNINDPQPAEREKRAHAAIQKAIARRENASDKERAFIDALGKRYSDAPGIDRKLRDQQYAIAMQAVAKAYPDDPDALTLYADALMNVMPWDYYLPDGTPKPDTSKAIDAVERAMKLAPNHPGANHLYIHLVEPSQSPDRAVPSAEKLETLVPVAGHLVHMPAHIYMRVGRYADAVHSNEMAIVADEAYLAQCRAQGIYPLGYYPHNLHFLAFALMMDGRREASLAAARKVQGRVPHDMKEVPAWGNVFYSVPVFAMARFGQWQLLLAQPQPPANMPFAQGIWHYGRGLAFARTNQLKAAARELPQVRQIQKLPAMKDYVAGANQATQLLELAALVLEGEMAAARKDYRQSIACLERAVAVQDSLKYNEPEDWYYPVRHTLGAVLLEARKPAEAERIYREDLKRNRENGWSLFGLAQSLRAQGKAEEAVQVEQRYKKTWERADVKLTATRF